MTPTVTGIAAAPSTTVQPGQTVTITLTLSDSVTVSGGTPTLDLNDGGLATYDAAATAALNNPSELVFSYLVSLNETSTSDLEITGVAPAGATIANSAGTAADLTAAEDVPLGVAIDTSVTWTAGGNGDWSDPAGWSSDAVPTASNIVIVPGNVPPPIVGVDGTLAAFSLEVEQTALIRQSGTLTLTAGMTLDGAMVTDVAPDGSAADGPAQVIAPGGIAIDAGGVLDADGTTTLSGDVFNNSQGVPAGSGGLLVAGTLEITGNLTGTGTTAIDSLGLLALQGSVAQTIAFTDDGAGLATLLIDDPAGFGGTITGVTPGRASGSDTSSQPPADVIDLAGITAATATYDGSTLTVFEIGGGTLSLAVAGSVAGALADAILTTGTDGNGGTDLFWQVGLTDDWIEGGDGDWTDPANWSLGFPPGTFDTAVFTPNGAATATIATGTVATADQLILGGAQQTISLAGELSLGTSPTLAGGTIAVAGGLLQLTDDASLDNAAITMADGDISAEPIAQADTSSLTFGPVLTLVQIAGNADVVSIFAGSSLINQGTIEATVAGGQFFISTFAQEVDPDTGTESVPVQINAGLIHVGNGDSLTAFGGTTFDNTASATLVVDTGGQATLEYVTWSNQGSILVGAGSTLTIQGDFPSASLNDVSYAGGTLVLDGVPSDSGPITAQGGRLIIDPSSAPPVDNGQGFTDGQSFDNAVLAIDTGATLELRGAPALIAQQTIDGQTVALWGGPITEGVISFNGPGATLTLDDPYDFQGTLDVLSYGDAIDFAGTTVTLAEFGNSALTITTADGGTAYYSVDGNFSSDAVTLESDGADGTLLLLPPAYTQRALDGYLAGATVFADADGSGTLAPGDAQTTTDAAGYFSLPGGTGPLVVTGGTDTATHLAFTGTLEAPNGSDVVTPLTTVVEALVAADPAEAVADAEQQVTAAFGITLATGQDLDDFDPIAGVLADAAGGQAAFVAEAAIIDTIDMIAAALTGIDGSLSSAAAAADVLAVLAGDIAAQPGQPLDFIDVGQVGSIIAGAAALDTALSSPPDAGLVSQIADVVTASNSALQQGVQSAATPQAALQFGSAVELVAQGEASAALHDIAQIDDAVANYTGSSLTQAIDSAADEVTTPCFCAGTLILTDRGEVAVEDLHIGDRVITLAGTARPIKWLGYRSYQLPFPQHHNDIVPVLFAAGSLGEDQPRRDLLVSPLHAMLLDGVLVPAGLLVNGVTIRRCPEVDLVRYIHIELDSHDVVFADGAPSETFVDCDSRLMFHNAAEFDALYPGDASPAWTFCAPRVEEGATLRRIRRRLAERAGCATPDRATAGRLEGFVDPSRGDTIDGWAWTPDQPDHRVELEILDGDGVIARVTADRYRADLRAAGIGDGRHSFAVTLSPGLSPWAAHQIRVRRVCDRSELGGSPLVIDARAGADLLRDRRFGAAIEAALRGARGTAELDTMIDVLAGEAARARRVRSRWHLRPPETPGPAPSRPPGPAAGRLAGMLELVNPTIIRGWACDIDHPGRPVVLEVFDGDVLLGQVTAGDARPDVREAGFGDGCAGFSLNLPIALAHWREHVIHVRRQADGAPLPGSPCVRPPMIAGGEPDQEWLRSLLLSLGGGEAGNRADDVVSRLIDRLEFFRGKVAAPVLAVSGRTVSPAPARPRVLIVDDRWPVAARDAGSNAIIGHMRALSALGHAVEFVASRELHLAPPAAATIGPDVTFHGAPAISSVEDLLRHQGETYHAIYLHRVSNALAYAGLARAWCKRARLLYGVADLHHLRLAREGIALGRPDLLARSRSVKTAELLCMRMADAVLTHSAAEARYLAREAPDACVLVVPWPVPVTTPREEDAGRSGIAFIGGHQNRPNADAVAWLAREIMPAVWAADPDIICHVVGPDWPAAFFADVDRRIRPAGRVAVLDAVLTSVRLTVAPMRFGAGIKGKVLDSLAAGVACVMSPIAAEGLPLCATLQGLVGRDAGEIAARIVAYHRDQAARETAGRAGTRMVDRAFGMASTTQGLARALGLAEAEDAAQLVAG